MKTVKMILNIIFELKFSFIIVFFLFLFSMLNLLILVGKVQYLYYTKDFFFSSNTENCMYYMPGKEQLDKKEIEQEKKTLGNFAAIKNVVKNEVGRAIFQDFSINLEICDSAYINTFSPVDEGKWLSDSENTDIADDQSLIPGVVAGYLFNDIEIGQVIDIVIGKQGDNFITQKIQVIGRKNEPSYFVSLNAQGANVSTADLFTEGHNFIFLKKQNIVDNDYIQTPTQYTSNYLLIADPLATDESKNKLYTYLNENGSFISGEDLLKNTNQYIQSRLQAMIPLPLFLCFISTFSLISITVMWINHIIIRSKVYMICGCSTKKIITLFILSSMMIAALSVCITSALIMVYPILFKNHLISYSFYRDMIINPSQIYILCLYGLFCIMVSLIIPVVKLLKVAKNRTKGRQSND